MKTHRHFILSACMTAVALAVFTPPVDAATIRAWGGNTYGEGAIPPDGDYVDIGAGYWHSIALLADGSLMAWGDNFYGQCNVPAGNAFVTVSAGAWHSVALRNDGTLAAWGRNNANQCTVPAGNNHVAVAAGGFHGLALTADGTIRAWGQNTDGQCNVPAGNGYLAIAGGGFHSLAISGDGSLRAWGQNTYGQCNVPAGTGYLAVAGGAYHSLAIAADGTLRAWGRNDFGQCVVPAGSNFAAVSCGERFSAALTSDGTLWAWGRNDSGQCNVPVGSSFSAVATGWFHTLAFESTPSLPPMYHDPVAFDQSVAINEDTPAVLTLEAMDEDGDALDYQVLVAPAHGALIGTAPNLTYTPEADYNGPDAFTFQVADGMGDSNVATVSIVVNAVNDAPIAEALVNGLASVTLDEESWEGASVTLDASPSSDPDGDALSYEWDLTNDGVMDGADAVLEATYPVGGPYTAVVRVTDPSGESATASVTITVGAGSASSQVAILKNMITEFAASGAVAPQLKSCLMAKLGAVEAALAKGAPQSIKVAVNNLNALANYISAQAGKKIEVQAADAMVARVESLVTQLGGAPSHHGKHNAYKTRPAHGSHCHKPSSKTHSQDTDTGGNRRHEGGKNDCSGRGSR